MTVDEIIAEIWELPWHKVLVVALKDDGILFVKTWWFWGSIGIISLSGWLFVKWWDGPVFSKGADKKRKSRQT